MSETKKGRIHIAPVYKVRWAKSREIHKNKYNFLYSWEEKRGNNRVECYVEKNISNNITEFKLTETIRKITSWIPLGQSRIGWHCRRW